MLVIQVPIFRMYDFLSVHNFVCLSAIVFKLTPLSCLLKEMNVRLPLIAIGKVFQLVQPLIDRIFCAKVDFLY